MIFQPYWQLDHKDHFIPNLFLRGKREKVSNGVFHGVCVAIFFALLIVFHMCVCNCLCAVQNPITAQITNIAGQALLSPLELNKGQERSPLCIYTGLEPSLAALRSSFNALLRAMYYQLRSIKQRLIIRAID